MSEFNDNIQYYLDDARKGVDDDPYLQPWIDRMQSEAQEDYNRSVYQLHDQAARGGLLGGGYYQGMLIGANEQFNEALQGQLADVYMGRYNQVEQNELQALGLLNNRDIAQKQAAAQIKAARIGAGVGHASIALQRQQWEANQPYTDMMNTINIMGGLNALGGYTEQPNYVPQSSPYYGPSAGAGAIMGGIGGALSGAGLANDMGYRFGNQPAAPQ